MGKIKWVLAGISFWILKTVLRYRLEGDSAIWLQSIKPEKINIYNREDFILAFCKQKHVLHVGFTDYPFTKQRIQNNELLHLKLKKVATSLIGIDNDQSSIDEYITLTHDAAVENVDITKDYGQKIKNKFFDVVVLSEVLEHLPDPVKAISILSETFPNGTQILVTVPNYTSLDSIAASLNRTESIHPHHYWYFSPYTLRKMFNKQFYYCTQLDFGMYYSTGVGLNAVLKNNPCTGDCILAIFTIQKNNQDGA